MVKSFFTTSPVFSWQIYLSNEIAGGYLSSDVVPTESLAKAIDQKKLDADILILQTKQAEFLKIKANRMKMIDPSL